MRAVRIFVRTLGVLVALAAVLYGAGWLMLRHSYGDLALVAAASNGDAAQVRRRLASGSPANSYHLEGSSALWWAVSSGSPETVEALLEAGADVNRGGQHNTVVDVAMGNLSGEDGARRARIVELLLARKGQFKDPREAQRLGGALAEYRRSLKK